MKIQLEQKSSNCPDHMICVACAQTFKVGQLRRLLTDDRSMLQGDLCSNCVHRSATVLQKLLKIQGKRLISSHPAAPERGQELLAIATEPVQFPSLWQWLIKKMEVLAAETTALEQARFNTTPTACSCRQAQKLEYIYQKSDKH
jgi:hypothetical protein